MTYNNDGWGPENMWRVLAHESGHIFGAPDEYAGTGDCDTIQSCFWEYGFLHVPNGNCEVCNAASTGCLMKYPDTYPLGLCAYTEGHFGWRDSDGDGPVDAIDPHTNKWEGVFPVQPGDLVHIYTTSQPPELVRTIACTADNVDTLSPTGYVIWDALNNYGWQVV